MKAGRELLQLLSHWERRNLYLLIVLSAFTALLQTVGIASIMPFLSVLTDPVVAIENRWLGAVYDTLDFQNTDSFLIFVGVAVLCALAISNGAIVLTAWITFGYSWMLGHNPSYRLLKDHVFRPYDFFLSRISSPGTKSLSEVWEVVRGIVLPGIKMIAHAIMALLIVALLVTVDPVLSIAVTVILGGFYMAIYLIVHRKLTTLGTARVRANGNRFQAANEAFGGIKDVKVLGKENTYLERSAQPSKDYATTKTASQVISSLPTYALELITFRNGASSLDEVHRDIRPRRNIDVADCASIPTLRLDEQLELRNITFAYQGTAEPVFDGFDLETEANASVAFVGATGSSETTLADIVGKLGHFESADVRRWSTRLAMRGIRA